MYDDIAVLKSFGEPTYDKYGNPHQNVTESTVFVQPRGVYASEFYNAAQLGLKPSVTLVMANREDYCDQKVLTFRGREYSVVRVDWNAQRDAISLICEERIGDPIYTEESES